MSANLLIIILSIVIGIAGLAVTIWSFIDTKRLRSHQQFLEERKQKRKEAEERFKSRTRI